MDGLRRGLLGLAASIEECRQLAMEIDAKGGADSHDAHLALVRLNVAQYEVGRAMDALGVIESLGGIEAQVQEDGQVVMEL